MFALLSLGFTLSLDNFRTSIVLGGLRAGARLLIVGDDKQLPPIVQASYPDPEPGEPILHRSLFECLKAQDPDRRFTATSRGPTQRR